MWFRRSLSTLEKVMNQTHIPGWSNMTSQKNANKPIIKSSSTTTLLIRTILRNWVDSVFSLRTQKTREETSFKPTTESSSICFGSKKLCYGLEYAWTIQPSVIAGRFRTFDNTSLTKIFTKKVFIGRDWPIFTLMLAASAAVSQRPSSRIRQ